MTRILHKPKPCKGNHNSNHFPGCGKEVYDRTYGLCPYCFWEWMQSTPEGNEHYSKKFVPRVQKNAKATIRKKKKEEREKLKSIARLVQETRVPFQKWIKLRDANDACISCGTTTAKIWHAGHYFKAELFTGLIFHEMNVNKQCEKCNTFLDGNESGYRKGLVKKYGENAVKELEEIADSLRKYKYSREELKEIKTKHQKLLREWKNS
ncbi:recombination protein NinG [Flagellimonas flava]|uniref:recombination protein NinG n=1 Tax=Flagellimonas flava TaxID=570519 RepID=UPI003D649A2D